MHNIQLHGIVDTYVDALINLIKAFSGCKITWIGDACFLYSLFLYCEEEWISFC